MNRLLSTILLTVLALPLWAKTDLVTIPRRQKVQMTIYNSADLTLVRERRELTLKKGANRLQFSWANTLIDPTSLSLQPVAHADQVDVQALVFPPRVKNLGVWTINSEISGKVPVEITYLTSRISWRAFYMGTLNPKETHMQLRGYVRVTNQSGEDYADAQTRLIVGKVNLQDLIAVLAQRQDPYGRPGGYPVLVQNVIPVDVLRREKEEIEEEADGLDDFADEMPARKEIKKEGLSEYFLYTIEGTETIPNGWSKRLPSFDAAAVPVTNLYKFEQERYGKRCRRFLSFVNDQDHELGDTPIPGGSLKVFRTVDNQQHLSFVGDSSFKYIPLEEDVELDLGAVDDVLVEPVLMSKQTDNFQLDRNGNIEHWDEILEYRIRVRNTRDLPVDVEITRNFPTPKWDLDRDAEGVDYEKIDVDTVRFRLNLKPRSEERFSYTLTVHR